MREIPRRPIVSGRDGPGSRAVAKVGFVGSFGGWLRLKADFDDRC